jgi:hypothetical protein
VDDVFVVSIGPLWTNKHKETRRVKIDSDNASHDRDSTSTFPLAPVLRLLFRILQEGQGRYFVIIGTIWCIFLRPAKSHPCAQHSAAASRVSSDGGTRVSQKGNLSATPSQSTLQPLLDRL